MSQWLMTFAIWAMLFAIDQHLQTIIRLLEKST
jgi:hypothetical protein